MNRETITHAKRQLTNAVTDILKLLDRATAKKNPAAGDLIKLLAQAQRMAGGEKRTYTKRANPQGKAKAARHEYTFDAITKVLRRKGDGLTAGQIAKALHKSHITLDKLGITGSKPLVALATIMQTSTLGKRLIVAKDERFYLKSKDSAVKARPGTWASKREAVRERQALLFEHLAKMLSRTPEGLTAAQMVEVLGRQGALESVGLTQPPEQHAMVLGRMIQLSKAGKALLRVNADGTYHLKKKAHAPEAQAEATA